VQLIVDHAVAEATVVRLSMRDPRLGEDARAAVQWLTGFDGEELPAVFSRRELQLFLWYQLPRKWLIRTDEQQAVAEALACFFDEVGVEAAPLAALCRSPQTAELIRSGGRKLASALEHSGLEPLDTLLLTWNEFMSIEEALEHDLVATLLEDALDNASIDAHTQSPAEAEEAIEPLLWLLDRLAGSVKLTQTGALPRVLVRAAVERYPDWWDTATVGPPYQEAELYPLGLLHDLIDELKIVRRQRSTLQVTQKGRALRADPQRLLSEVAATLAPELPAELDLPLARLVVDEQPDEIEWSLYGLLAPFNGIVVERRTPTAVTSGGRTLAATILDARAHGPRNTLD